MIKNNRTTYRTVLLMGVLPLAAGCHYLGMRPAQTAREERVEHAPADTGERVGKLQIALAKSMEAQGDFDKASSAYKHILDEHPKNAEAAHRLAVLCDRQENFADSEKYFRRALKLRPSDPDILNDYGYSLYVQHRWSDAEEKFRKAIAINADYRPAHNNLGLVLAETNSLEEAFAEFRKGARSPAEAQMNVGYVLSTKAQLPEAQAAYAKALKSDPSCKIARERLKELDAIIAKAEPSGRNKSESDQVALTSAHSDDE